MEHQPDNAEGTATSASDPSLEKNANLDNIVLALLFSSDEPVSARKLSAVVEDATAEEVKEAIARWEERFDQEAWSIRIEQVAGGYQVATRTDYAIYISRLYQGKRKFRLSRAALETLAIIAYKQPVTRAEIDNVRGVGSGGVIANLMERSLIKITGKAKVLGAPFLYGTTAEFLEYLGLNSLGDLPSLEELEALLEKEAYPEEAIEGDADAEGSLHTGEGEGTEDEEMDFAGAVAALDEATRTASETVAAAKESGERAGAASVAKDDETTSQRHATDTDEPESTIPTVDFSPRREEEPSGETEEDSPDESADDEEKR